MNLHPTERLPCTSSYSAASSFLNPHNNLETQLESGATRIQSLGWAHGTLPRLAPIWRPR